MEWLRLALAMLLPWLAGAASVAWAWKPKTPGGTIAALGYGFPVGLLMTAGLIVLLDVAGAGQAFWSACGLLALIAAGGWYVSGMQQRLHPAPLVDGWRGLRAELRESHPLLRLGLGLLLVLIVLRLAGTAVEVSLRPLFPWDGWNAWALRAKVWFESGELVALGGRRHWQTAHDMLHNVGGTIHPPTVSLFHLWVARAMGRWHDALINLPWLLLGVSLLLALYGQLRVLEAPRLLALAACYALISMPLVATHLMLGTYADIWIMALFGLAGMSLYLFLTGHGRGHGVLAVALCLALLAIKASGMIWVAAVLAGMLVGLVRGRWLIAAALVGALGFMAAYFTTGIAFELPRLGTVAMAPGDWRLPLELEDGWLNPAVLHAVTQHLFVWSSWHLFWFAAVAVLMALTITSARDRAMRGMLASLLTGLTLLYGSLFLTRLSEYAILGTVTSRVLMAPALLLVFLGAVLVVRRCTEGRRAQADEAREADMRAVSA